MILLPSLLILLVLALTPAHVVAEDPQIMPDTHVMAQMGAMGDCCDSGTHQAGCQMQQPLPMRAHGVAYIPSSIPTNADAFVLFSTPARSRKMGLAGRRHTIDRRTGAPVAHDATEKRRKP